MQRGRYGHCVCGGPPKEETVTVRTRSTSPRGKPALSAVIVLDRARDRLPFSPLIQPPGKDEAHRRRQDEQACVHREARSSGRLQSENSLDQEGGICGRKNLSKLSPNRREPGERIIQWRKDPEKGEDQVPDGPHLPLTSKAAGHRNPNR